MSVLVVGAGFTSSVLCKTLRATAPLLNVTVWEKSRGAGGRSSTKRDGEHSCDIGTQYLTHWKTDTFFDPYITLLKSVNVISEFTGKIVDSPSKYDGEDCRHYIAPKGMNSLTKYFLSGTNTFFGTKVVSIKVLENKKILVCNEDNRSAEFDMVVLTIPAPQLLHINMEPQIPQEVEGNIKKVEFTPRFSLMVVYDSVPDTEWIMKYHEDDVVRFTVWDHLKRRKGLNPTLLCHSSAPYAVKNLDVKSKEEAGEEMLDRLKVILPELPEPIKVIPHFWRFGQVYKPYCGNPGYVVLNEDPLIVAGGDSFMRISNLSKAAKSGEMIAEIITKHCGLPNIDFKETLKR